MTLHPQPAPSACRRQIRGKTALKPRPRRGSKISAKTLFAAGEGASPTPAPGVTGGPVLGPMGPAVPDQPSYSQASLRSDLPVVRPTQNVRCDVHLAAAPTVVTTFPASPMRSSLTLSNIRLDVVTLLCDADFRRRPDTGRWSHLDGRPFTKAEQTLAFSATREEFEIAAAQIKREGDYQREYEDAVEALPKLLMPYLAQLGHDGPVADVLPLMTAEDRAEFERLRDILAPDGWLYTPTNE